MKTRKQKNVELCYREAMVGILKEGYDSDILKTRLEDEEYTFIEEKIIDVMKKHYDYNIVKSLTSKLPVIVTVVAKVLKFTTKTTIVSALVSIVVENIINQVIKGFILPTPNFEDDKKVDTDEMDTEFDFVKFAENPIFEEKIEEEVIPSEYMNKDDIELDTDNAE